MAAIVRPSIMYSSFIWISFFAFSFLQDGVVITKTDSIRGTITVNQETNLITIRKENAYQALYASQIEEVISIEHDIPVKYISAAYGPKEGKMLFKVISEGELTLLFRAKVPNSMIEQTYFPAYHVFINGSIKTSISAEKDVLKLMKKHKKEIQDYLATNLLYIDDGVMLKEIFDYYNKLD